MKDHVMIEEGQNALPAIVLAMAEEGLRENLSAHLRDEGYRTLLVADSGAVLRLVQHYPLLLVLLDRALPPRDGLDLCRLLRAQSETAWLPIVMIATQQDETDVVVGLEVGADDYIVWPCRWHLVRARIRALLRRSRYMPSQPALASEPLDLEVGGQGQAHILKRGDVCIDLAGRLVTHHEQRVDLSARLFDLLVYLARHPGRVLSRKQLLEQVHQDEVTDERQVDVYVHWLREKLEDDPAHPQQIQTVRGVGYRFRGE